MAALQPSLISALSEQPAAGGRNGQTSLLKTQSFLRFQGGPAPKQQEDFEVFGWGMRRAEGEVKIFYIV